MAPRHGLALTLALVLCTMLVPVFAMNPTPEHGNGHEDIQITEHEIDAYIEGNVVDIDSAHREGLPHRGVWAVVIDGKQRVVLIKRGKDTVTCPETWSIVGEHNDPGETYFEALRRGVEEELGLTWATDVEAHWELDPSASLLNITYWDKFRETVHRRDLQWTMPYVVALKDDASIEVDHREIDDLLLMPFDGFMPWWGQHGHEICRTAKAHVAKFGGVKTRPDTPDSFAVGSIGDFTGRQVLRAFNAYKEGMKKMGKKKKKKKKVELDGREEMRVHWHEPTHDEL